MNWEPIYLTAKLALISTVLLFFIALPVAYWLAYSKSKWKPVVSTLVSMPLVLPPTVIGFYLLIFFSPNNCFGEWLNDWFGVKLAFSFTGLVLASLIYSLPFMVHPLQNGLAALPESYQEMAYVLGKSKWTTFWRVLLPNCKNSILSGVVMTFAHTVGEFGIVLMIGGNIPGETKVASIAIYDEVESLNYASAHEYALILFSITFVILLALNGVNRRVLNKKIND